MIPGEAVIVRQAILLSRHRAREIVLQSGRDIVGVAENHNNSELYGRMI
jgi:hypothetical protein